MRERRYSATVHVVLSDEELAQIRDLAGEIPLSTFARSVLVRYLERPESLELADPDAPRDPDPRLCRLDIVLTQEHAERLRELAGKAGVSPFVRSIVRALVRRPDRLVHLLHESAAPPQPVAEG